MKKEGGTPRFFSLPDFIDLSERGLVVLEQCLPKSLEKQDIVPYLRGPSSFKKGRENNIRENPHIYSPTYKSPCS